MSTKLKIGVVCNWTGMRGLPISSEHDCSNDGALAAGYLHTSSLRIQLSHAGRVSWHFHTGVSIRPGFDGRTNFNLSSFAIEATLS